MLDVFMAYSYILLSIEMFFYVYQMFIKELIYQKLKACILIIAYFQNCNNHFFYMFYRRLIENIEFNYITAFPTFFQPRTLRRSCNNDHLGPSNNKKKHCYGFDIEMISWTSGDMLAFPRLGNAVVAQSELN